jgi:hypothetical protein
MSQPKVGKAKLRPWVKTLLKLSLLGILVFVSYKTVRHFVPTTGEDPSQRFYTPGEPEVVSTPIDQPNGSTNVGHLKGAAQTEATSPEEGQPATQKAVAPAKKAPAAAKPKKPVAVKPKPVKKEDIKKPDPKSEGREILDLEEEHGNN